MLDLTQFCTSDTRPYDLHAPFVRDGYEYATDGRILIRHRSDKTDSVGRFPDVGSVTWMFDDMTGLRDFDCREILRSASATTIDDVPGVCVEVDGFWYNVAYLSKVLAIPGVRHKAVSELLVFGNGEYEGVLHRTEDVEVNHA